MMSRNYPVENVRVTITWKSGSKVKYVCFPVSDLDNLLASYYRTEMSRIRKITVKEISPNYVPFSQH